MKKTGNQIYRAHSKSKRDFGDAIDWAERPKHKAGRTIRRRVTRLANRCLRRESLKTEQA
jgi:hypothetical protein